MELRVLQYFLAIAREETILGAAERLHMTQPTLSRQMKELEEELLERINKIGIGPGGLGGSTTALAVNVNTYPTHIAGLPVAVNICCHVNRHVIRTI